MTKKDTSVEPDGKRRRKGSRVADANKAVTTGTSSSPISKTSKSSDATQQTVMKRSQSSLTPSCDSANNIALTKMSLMELEMKESLENSSTDDIDTFRKTCKEIQMLVTEIDGLKAQNSHFESKAIKERRIKSTLLGTSLKRLNRHALLRSKAAKDQTHEMKQKVDILQLDLQNLLYEVMHMKKDIQKCTEFTSKDEEIDLIDVESFYEEATPDISKVDVTRNDKHLQMLARLEWELFQRKKLATLKSKLLRDKLLIDKELSKQNETLSSLQPSIAEILKATLPLQNQLCLKIDEKKIQYETALYLPRPLYVLYVHANAQCEGGEHDLNVAIDGDVKAAKALLHNNTLVLDEFEDSDPEDENGYGDKEGNKRRKHIEDKTRARIDEQRRSILRKHPLQIHIKISCKGTLVLNLTLAYFTSMDIVTVTSSIDYLEEGQCTLQSSSSIVSTESLLKSLFEEDDDGETIPNFSSQIKLEKLGMQEFSAYISELGRPYRWAQRICGLCCLSKTQDKNLISDDIAQSQNFACTLKEIKGRMATRVALQKQLIELESLSIPASKYIALQSPSAIQARLVHWECISYSDFLELYSPKDSMHLFSSTDLYYALRVRKEKEELTAAVSIGVNYPWQPPLFVVKQSQSMVLNDLARAMECELNVNSMDLVGTGKPSMLLSNQLHRLLSCFDVYCETGGLGLKEEKLYLRKQRGRDRSRPYKYIQEKGLFVHCFAD